MGTPEAKDIEPVEPTSIVPTVPAAALPGAMRRMHDILPRTYAELERLAAQIAKSTFCPKEYKDRVGDILICMQHGAEIGLLPLQALQCIAVINGRPCVWGDGALALVQASGLLEDKEEVVAQTGQTPDDITATCMLKRRGIATPVRAKFSVADAKKAGLWGKQGPWTNYPRRMLQMRARSWALRDGFADLLKGLSIVEEAMDITPLQNGETPAPPVRRAATRSIEASLAVTAEPESPPVSEEPAGSGPQEELL